MEFAWFPFRQQNVVKFCANVWMTKQTNKLINIFTMKNRNRSGIRDVHYSKFGQFRTRNRTM